MLPSEKTFQKNGCWIVDRVGISMAEWSQIEEEKKAQLLGGVEAVFSSWNTARAISYRDANELPHDWGTAVNVQTMVFGNMGNDCATGVAFTRNPSTGENLFYGEYLPNAQGEDVVAGIRDPHPIVKSDDDEESLEVFMPKAFAELVAIGEALEQDLKDMQAE